MHRSPVAALAATGGLILLLGACSQPPPAVRPSPVPSGTPPPPATIPPPEETPTPTANASAGPDVSSLVDLGRELRIGVLGPEHTDDMLDFASDGQAIIFSSGVLPDVTTTGGAPDLWRIEPFGDPELIWKNPNRDHTLARIGGDMGMYAFVDMPTTGERAWTLHLIPRHRTEALVLDRHPGDEDVPSFVPSFSAYEQRIVWTAFDRGPNGPVSQLLTAAEPSWEPTVLLEYPASEVEIWLPSQNGSDVVYVEVRYADDGLTDERSVWLMSTADPASARRLDTSGRATMPVLIPDAVLWKEADPGYNMFNWGRMFRYDRWTEEVSEVDLGPQDYVNYPSGGSRYAAWWGNDSFAFGVYDHILGESLLIERTRMGSETGILRPHLAGDLLAWLRVVGSDEHASRELRYAWMPDLAELRDR